MTVFLTLKEFQSFTPTRPTYAVFGCPARHSMSPELHLSFAKKSNKSIDYLRIEVSEEEFSSAMELAKEKKLPFFL